MPSDKRTAALPPALIVWVLAVAGVAANAWPCRRRVPAGCRPPGPLRRRAVAGTPTVHPAGTPQRGLRPRLAGVPGSLTDGVPDRRGSGASSSNGCCTTASGAGNSPPPPEAVPAAAPTASSAAAASTLAETDSSPAPPATVAVEEVDPQNAVETNTQQRPRAPGADGTVQLPPEILVDRHLVRAERLLAAGDPDGALEAMNEILALQEEHDLVLQNGFDFEYAQVAYAAGHTETAIASANQYLVAAGREGEFYREALELLDSAEVRLEREAAERRRAEAERRRDARWPPGHVFRDCETCPEMVVLPGSAVALGRYEVTVGEYRAFASATTSAQASPCSNTYSDRDDYRDHSWRDSGFPQTDRHPVTCISWDDAQAYISWLRETTGAGYRLPTYEELRGAAVSQPGCDINQAGSVGPLGTCGCHSRNPWAGTGNGTCPVGTYGRNRLGLSDMLGNVDEWTSSCRGDCGSRLRHGGSWSDVFIYRVGTSPK